jgi:hypothetical protein
MTVTNATNILLHTRPFSPYPRLRNIIMPMEPGIDTITKIVFVISILCNPVRVDLKTVKA